MVYRLASHLGATLGDEQPGQLVIARCEIAFDRPEFVAGHRLLDRKTVLQSPHPQPRRCEVDLVASDRDGLAHPQRMAVHHQDQQAIANAVPPNFGGVKQTAEFAYRQKVFVPLVQISGFDVTACRPILFTFRRPAGLLAMARSP